MSGLTASLDMDADVEAVSAALTQAKGRWTRCRVNLSLRAKIPGSKHYDDYVLPAITAGDCTTALDHIQKLLRQTRITNEEAVVATARARALAILTKA